jgi:IMP dehydrogenase
MDNIKEGLTYDDVLIIPKYSNILSRSDVSLKIKLTENIILKIPIISANMDTITEDNMAIGMAKLGGLGIIHRYCTIDEQVQMIKNVKRFTNYIIYQPYILNENDTVDKIKRNNYLVVNNDSKLVGILSKKDILNNIILKSNNIKDIMNKNIISIQKSELIKGEDYIISILLKNKIEKLPIVDENNILYGLITLRDIMYRTENKDIALLDSEKRLMVGGAVGVIDDYLERTKKLIEAGCDIICIDVAHGHHQLCGNALKEIKKLFPNIPVIAGNVCTKEGVKYLYDCGANVIKVGIGSGSICITRIQTGIGVPQLKAVMECAKEAKRLGITIISDGGHSGKIGNIFKALCAGSSASMLGNFLSGTDETPGQIIIKDNKKMKMVRGMAGIISNFKKKQKLNENTDISQMTSEGVEGYVDYKGPLKDIINQICGGIRSGLSYVGCNSLEELKTTEIEFIKITQSGKKESGSHNIQEL